MAQTSASATGVESSTNDDEDTRRFEIELEFVQCLASPSYLNFLAQNEYLDSPDFVAYLNYLQYWRTPQYARFLIFPHALFFLQLLQDAAFRKAIKRPDFAVMAHQQQGWFWQFGKNLKPRSETVNGTSMQNAPALPTATSPGGGGGGEPPGSTNTQAGAGGVTLTDGVNHHLHHHRSPAIDSSQQRPQPARNVSAATPNPGSSITIP